MYKRSQPVSKGRSHPILVRRSNITVIVDVSANGGIKAKKTKTPKTAKAAVEATNLKTKMGTKVNPIGMRTELSELAVKLVR